MKTSFVPALLGAFAFALMTLAIPLGAIADVTPDEQSSDQVQTMRRSQGPYYVELDSLANSLPAMELLRQVSDKVDQDPSLLPTAFAWAKDKVSVKDFQKVNSLYFLIYTDMALRSAGQLRRSSPYYLAYSKAAYQSLLTFEALFLTDAARCLNPDAGKPLPALLMPRLDALNYVPGASTPAEMATYWKTALNYEAASVSRPGNGEICSNGVAGVLAQETGQPPPSRADATFIDAAKWMPLRDNIRSALAARWQEDYAPVRKAYEARAAGKKH